MAKKGSLNLSINAIVVLILAITMLGLGLAFINNMFGGATNRLNRLMTGLSDNEKQELMNSLDRLSMTSKTVEVQKGKAETVYFAVRNDETTPLNINELQAFCDKKLDATQEELNNVALIQDDVSFSTFTPDQLEAAESQVLPLQIKPSSDSSNTIYGCKIRAVDINGEEYSMVRFDLVVK